MSNNNQNQTENIIEDIKDYIIMGIPILFCFFAILIGYEMGSYYSYKYYTEDYSVTIHWSENESDCTVIEVNETFGWNITEELSRRSKSGYEFAGLSKSPMGGIMYTNSAGYSIKTIHSDIELYAVWIPIE